MDRLREAIKEAMAKQRTANYLRPHDQYPGLLHDRQLIYEKSDWSAVHPFSLEVRDWSFTKNMLVVRKIPDTPNVVWIDKIEDLVTASDKISLQPEISISVKEYENCYRGMISVLQIGLINCVYLVDCFALRNSVCSVLKGLFANSRLLKVFLN